MKYKALDLAGTELKINDAIVVGVSGQWSFGGIRRAIIKNITAEGNYISISAKTFDHREAWTPKNREMKYKMTQGCVVRSGYIKDDGTAVINCMKVKDCPFTTDEMTDINERNIQIQF